MILPAEKGDFLALDLGGTNFRVLHVRVVEEEQKVLKMDSQICAITQEMMLGPGEKVSNMLQPGVLQRGGGGRNQSI